MIFFILLPFISQVMKKIILLLFTAGAMILLPVSCNTGNDLNQNDVYVFPSGAVADYIATIFSSAAGGINDHLENTAILAGRKYSSSGMTDSNFTHINHDSIAAIKYEYNVNYSFAMLATSPPKFTLNFGADGSFTGPLINSNTNLTGNYTVTGVDTMSTYYLLNGPGNGGGNQTSIFYNNVSFSSTFRVMFKNVTLDKASHMVVSGSATLSSSGIGPANIPFSYSGTFTFLGNRLATLLFDGKTYQVDLATAKITK